MRESFSDFQKIITKLIEAVIIPLLPLHIFGIFLNMTVSGQVMSVITMFLKVIIVIFVLHVLLLLIQFTIAGSMSGKNPLRLLKNMLPAYATALGTQSSAATIPVTLAQAVKNGVRENIAIIVIDGNHVYVRRTRHLHFSCRIHHDVRGHNDSSSRCTGWRNHGSTRSTSKHVRCSCGRQDRRQAKDWDKSAVGFSNICLVINHTAFRLPFPASWLPRYEHRHKHQPLHGDDRSDRIRNERQQSVVGG